MKQKVSFRSWISESRVQRFRLEWEVRRGERLGLRSAVSGFLLTLASLCDGGRNLRKTIAISWQAKNGHLLDMYSIIVGSIYRSQCCDQSAKGLVRQFDWKKAWGLPKWEDGVRGSRFTWSRDLWSGVMLEN